MGGYDPRYGVTSKIQAAIKDNEGPGYNGENDPRLLGAIIEGARQGGVTLTADQARSYAQQGYNYDPNYYQQQGGAADPQYFQPPGGYDQTAYNAQNPPPPPPVPVMGLTALL